MKNMGGKRSTGEGSAGEKESTWEERVEGCGRKYAVGGTSIKFKRILGVQVGDKTFEKYRKCARGGKSTEMWNETQAEKTIIGGKSKREAKDHREAEGSLATAQPFDVKKIFTLFIKVP